MAATELKRYNIREGGWDEFLAIWRRIVRLRQRHGFAVQFAYADREINMFTWAIRHEGDFELAARQYYEDPERVELDHVVDYVTAHEIRRVEVQPLP